MPRILLTRPRDQSEAFATELSACGWSSMIWPLLTIRSLLAAPVKPAHGQSLIFTSARAIDALPDPAPLDIAAFCVGSATAEAAKRRGFEAVTDLAGDADGLVQALREQNARRYVHVRGVHSRGDVAARLTAAGRPTEEVIAYEAVAADAAPREIDTAIMTGKIDAVALFSPRTASIFTRLASAEWLTRLSLATLYAISPAAAKPAMDLGFAKVVLAKRPNGSEMRAAICGAGKE